MFPIRGVPDTGAGPNIIRERILPPDWREHAAKKPIPRVTDASKNAMVLRGVVMLYVRIGNMTTRTHFLVASNLAVNAILGTEFIDRHLRGILPKERRVVFREECDPPGERSGTRGESEGQGGPANMDEIQ